MTKVVMPIFMTVCSNPHIDVRVNPDHYEVEHMRIGELSERTGTSRRLLRYYEEQGLIFAQRCQNGYRSYDDRLVDRVLQIRGLLDAGLPTRIIKQILPCLDQPSSIVFDEATPEMLALLEDQLTRMSRRIDCLARNRDAIAEYLDAVRANS
ncbi:MerR family transcriptional regulator [Nocardia arthritidis]|uniref:MerR family transcriptional regulator n=2 Tax=Nocardia arthritidis TaxID=228602 RepID=A0A6G9Y5V8_9NOCA|nr:MerR family transcriptional regulator [Nocardia arthritidis]